MSHRTYPTHFQTHPDTELRPSAVQGKGLFACVDMPAGTVVEVMGGMPMTDAELVAYTRTTDRYNSIQVEENLHLVEPADVTATRNGSINHSCDSNLWMTDAVTFVARRAITAGEEITLDYALFTTVPWELSPCCCGAPDCRGTVTGDDWKRPDVQARYAGHFSPFINARIAALPKPDSHDTH